MAANYYYPSKDLKDTRKLRRGYEFSKFKKNYESDTYLNGTTLQNRQEQLEKDRKKYQPSKPVNVLKPVPPIKPISTKATTKKSDMVKKSKMYRYAQAASHVLCKRAAASGNLDPALQAALQAVKDRYVRGLKATRDRSILQDVLRSALRGSISGGTIGMIPGGLFGAATLPIRDRGTQIPLHDSLLRGASTGILSGFLAGGVAGAGAGALGALFTRDARRNEAIERLKALGIKD